MSFWDNLFYFWKLATFLFGVILCYLLISLGALPLEKFLKTNAPSFWRRCLNKFILLCFFAFGAWTSLKYVLPYFSSDLLEFPPAQRSMGAPPKASAVHTSVEAMSLADEAADRASLPEKNFFLENEQVAFEISAWGGDISKIILKEYAKEQSASDRIDLSLLAKVRSGWRISSDDSFVKLPERLEFQESADEAGRELEERQAKGDALFLETFFSDPTSGLQLKLIKNWRLEPGNYVPTLQLYWEELPSEKEGQKRISEKMSISQFCEINFSEKLTPSELKQLRAQQISDPKIVSFNAQGGFKRNELSTTFDPAHLGGGLVEEGWVGLASAPFLSVIFPNTLDNGASFHQYHILDPASHRYRIGFESAAHSMLQAQTPIDFSMYFGPMDPLILSEVAPGLERSVDHGRFLWPVRQLFLLFLRYFYEKTGNWGWALLISAVLLQWILGAPFLKLSIDIERRHRRLSKGAASYTLLKEEQEKRESTRQLFQVGFAAISFILLAAIRPLISHSIHLRHQPFLMQLNDLAQPDPSGCLLFLILIFQKFSGLDWLASTKISSHSKVKFSGPDGLESTKISSHSKVKIHSLTSKILGLCIVGVSLLVNNYVYAFPFWAGMIASILCSLLGSRYSSSEKEYASNSMLQRSWPPRLKHFPWVEVGSECLQNFFVLLIMYSISVGVLLVIVSSLLADFGRRVLSVGYLYGCEIWKH